MSARTGRLGATRIGGELLLTVGAVLLLFLFYEAFWSNLDSRRLQNEAAAGLEQRWDDAPAHAVASEPVPPAVPAPGEAFARIHLPTLGDDAVYAVVEGVRAEDLRTGPGHYPGTQMPGEAGNAALAGHRNGSGAVFEHLDRLASCDAIVIETATQWLTYRLLPMQTDGAERLAAAQDCLTPEQSERIATGDYADVRGAHITTPEAVEVIAPVPGAASGADGAALERLLTLTTCHPMYSNAERLIVHAVLTETTAKADGRPAALED
ncbi:class E sortase [Dietzia sp. HMSC21D01]|uniref:Class E sortase n=1 Tax=Dietzia cinnamea TaxID=321318 RepID=A0AAW5Q5D7_9ACTN|nr:MULTISPECIES: class E sortase [Dietzia]MCT1863580.1 class E sortase [Dietzia cinnamea]MCT2029893.1 class E sortase [Dietzia cinnamea]MCT2033251.1 class E sortase [Dietzia cinnamea]MCT2075867.1 class E sortase [Dietzia cinnamea]MCT2106198.1 class E sortase [Dietzia cinnamea]